MGRSGSEYAVIGNGCNRSSGREWLHSYPAKPVAYKGETVRGEPRWLCGLWRRYVQVSATRNPDVSQFWLRHQLSKLVISSLVALIVTNPVLLQPQMVVFRGRRCDHRGGRAKMVDLGTERGMRGQFSWCSWLFLSVSWVAIVAKSNYSMCFSACTTVCTLGPSPSARRGSGGAENTADVTEWRLAWLGGLGARADRR